MTLLPRFVQLIMDFQGTGHPIQLTQTTCVSRMNQARSGGSHP